VGVREIRATSNVSSGGIGPGRFILVVGPSGAGKDTLIRLAQSACVHDGNIVFPRRVVTREATAFEGNQWVSPDQFWQARGEGKFAVHWEAHGHCYALPCTINDDIRANRTVVANVSRTMIDAMRRAYANAVVVLITAPVQILAERLESRRRSSDGRLAERLVRKVDTLASAADLTITNVGSAEHHARELVRIIRGD
jgi:ribose 1,5-bisphosphokinase